MKIVFFPSTTEINGTAQELNWVQFSEYAGKVQVQHTKDGELYSLAIYKEGKIQRKDANVESVAALVLDFDKENRDPLEIAAVFADFKLLYHSTWRNDLGNTRFRVIIPLKALVLADDWKYFIKGFLEYYKGKLDGVGVPEMKTLSRCYFRCITPPERVQYAFSGTQDGILLAPEYLTALGKSLDAPKEYKPFTATTNDDIESALQYIESDDYHQWVKIGMALKTHLGNAGFSLWDKWSHGSTKYQNIAETRKKWDSFKRNDVGIGTLFFEASQGGYIYQQDGKEWKPKVQVFLTPDDANDDVDLKPPNLVGALQDYFLRTAIYPHPDLCLGAAIAFLGGLMAHKTKSYTDLRTNFYCLGLAPTGSGKNHVNTRTKLLLHGLDYQEMLIGVPVSGTGLLTPLYKKKGKGLIIWDEFGKYLGQMVNQKSASYTQEIATYLIELNTSANMVFFGREYANKDGTNAREDISQPCLSISALSAAEPFYAAINGASAADGFLNRWLIFKATEDYPIEQQTDNTPLERHIQAEIKHWIQKPVNHAPSGNLDESINPEQACYEKAAREALDKFAKDTRQRMRENDNEIFRAVYARAAENAHKLALIAQSDGLVDLYSARWAISVAKRNSAFLFEAMKNSISDNENERQLKKLLAIIRDGGIEGIARAEIYRKTQSIPKRIRNDLIADLVESGRVLCVEENTGGRPSQRFVLHGD